MLLSQGAAGQESKRRQDCKRKAKDNKEVSNAERSISETGSRGKRVSMEKICKR